MVAPLNDLSQSGFLSFSHEGHRFPFADFASGFIQPDNAESNSDEHSELFDGVGYTEPELWVTLPQAARFLGISNETLDDLIHSGVLRAKQSTDRFPTRMVSKLEIGQMMSAKIDLWDTLGIEIPD